MRNRILLALAVALLQTVGVMAQRYVGGDISMLPYYEAASCTYYDTDGTTLVTANYTDLIYYLKAKGWNSMRVRLFVDPVKYKTTDETYWNEGARQTLNDVKVLGKRIKDAGLKFMLDLHYSDTWTDPDKHLAPQSWKSASYATEVYDYTKDVLEKLVAYGAKPDFIQVGNEVNNGMLWSTLWGTATNDKCYANSSGTVMTNFISYIKQGCAACREVCPNAKIIFHVAMEYNATLDNANWAAKTWPATLATNSVDYDIIGLSYYPYFHGPLNYLTTLLTYLQDNFPTKEIQLVEVGYPHAYYPSGSDVKYDYPNTADTDGKTFAATDDGQLAFTEALISKLSAYSRVTGLYWWYPEANEKGNNTGSQVTSAWYNYGLWDNATGKAMKAVEGLKDFTTQSVTVGASDNSTSWLGAISNIHTLGNCGRIHYTFRQTRNTEHNNNGFLLYAGTANATPNWSNASIILKGCNYEEKDASSGNCSNNFNWETFYSDMNGATVDMYVTYINGTFAMTSTITTTGDTEYTYSYSKTLTDAPASLAVCLSVDNACLTISTDDYEPFYTITANKGDITSMINGDFETNADGWTGGARYKDASWTTRNWRGTDVNGFYEMNDGDGNGGPLTYTIKNMPAGTYKVVAATHGAATRTITPSVAGTSGTAYQCVGDQAAVGEMEINTNGVEMPYSPLGGFTTNDAGHRWHWITATGTLASAGDLVISFSSTGSGWVAIDDVHLYCTSLDGTSYTTSLNGISSNKDVPNTGECSVVTCDIVATNPNVVFKSNSGSAITTAAGQSLNNCLYHTSAWYMSKMVLYDGYTFEDYPVSHGGYQYFAQADGDNSCVLYREIPANTWCTLTVPFWPRTALEKKYPSSFNSETGILSFSDATTETCWNNEPMLIKSSTALTSIRGKRQGNTKGESSGITYGDMVSGSGVPMHGTYSRITNINDLPGTHYVLGTDNMLYKVDSEVSLNPFRAYFTIPEDKSVKASTISLNFDSDETGIERIGQLDDSQSNNFDGAVYNLAGQRVNKAQSGIYIVNGKKVVVK